MKKRIAILGSTGSVGINAVKVIEHLCDELELFGVAAKSNIELLAKQSDKLNCRYAVVSDGELECELENRLPKACRALSGEQGLVELATHPDVDMVLCSIVGTGGLVPVLEAVKAGKDVAIASKEVLVAAGELVMREVHNAGNAFLPVDSEHSAIFQCLEGKDHGDISRLILTASGGAFRNTPLEKIKRVDYQDALVHPTWNMGPKVTVDSASMMNKALELIEASYLFSVPESAIDVLIHPQSIVHSMVEFIDGTILAQMSTPDMRFPIQYALTYPKKHPGSLEQLDFTKFSTLDFELPDRKRFPSLDFARFALQEGGTMPAVMNSANEVAVERFSCNDIRFTDIWNIIEKTMSLHKKLDASSLDAILSADKWARITAENMKV